MLRVAPPTAIGVGQSPADNSGVVARSVTAAIGAYSCCQCSKACCSAASAQAAASAPVPVAPAAPATSGDDDLGFIWPSSGTLIAGFDEARNKGYDIGGKAGDPVLAAADGRVVYAGAGLRGYGNLIILIHNNTFLTAYAHKSKFCWSNKIKQFGEAKK